MTSLSVTNIVAAVWRVAEAERAAIVVSVTKIVEVAAEIVEPIAQRRIAVTSYITIGRPIFPQIINSWPLVLFI